MTSASAPELDAFGVRWTLDTSGLDEPLAGRLRTLWARAGAGATGPHDASRDPSPRFVVARDGDRVLVEDGVHSVPDVAVPYTVSRALTVASIGRRAGSCLLLHAAGVAAPDGSVLALVAPSGTGKTTAARVLSRSLGYVTDETVAVEEDLTVRSYPKPLSLVVDPDSPHDKEEASPDELGLLVAPDALRLAGTVLLARDPEAATPRLEPVGLVDAAVEVVPQTSALLRMPRPMDALASALSLGGGPWRLVYAEIEDCVGLLSGLLPGGAAGTTSEPDAGPDGSDVGPSWTSESGPAVLDEPGTGNPPPGPTDAPVPGLADPVGRARWRHALHTDGSSLVLVGSVPMGLPGLAATLWRALEAPLPVGRLVEAAVAVHGRHPDAERVVVETVHGMLRTGVLDRLP